MSIHSMTVTIEPHGGRPTYEAACSDLSADCHYICAEGCESWGEIVRNEDGQVLHHLSIYGSDDAPHHMEHVEECNYIGFLDAGDEPQEDMTGKPFVVVIPATFTYADEAVTWAVSE